MSKLHQVIAIERGVSAESERQLAEVRRILAVGGDQDPLTGTEREYAPVSADGEELPPQSRKVQVTVLDLLEALQESLVRLFDVKYTREYGNTFARADVLIDDVTLLADVPAGYLLFLENQLAQLITGLIDKLPVLNPATEWADDPALPRGVFKAVPQKRHRAERVPQVQVLHPPTKEHPAQVRPYETEKIVGYWTEVKLSGQLPAREVQAIRRRATRLLEAVRYARELANSAEVEDKHAGEAVLGYVLGQ